MARMIRNPGTLLWVDCTAGMLVGTLMLLLEDWLTSFYALPAQVILFVGAANCIYASCSFLLALRRNRSLVQLRVLVLANLAWSLVCCALLSLFFRSATVFGSAHLAGEALFVGGLALLEWRYRRQIIASPRSGG